MDRIAVRSKQMEHQDKEERKQMIEQNLGLVHHIVKRFKGRDAELEDLFQIGVIGLIKAVDKFDLSYEVKFSTYAVPLISGEIKRFLRDDGMVKVSRSMKEKGTKIRILMQKEKKEKGRELTIEDLEKLTDYTKEDILMALEATVHVDSIYRAYGTENEKEDLLVDHLADRKKTGGELPGTEGTGKDWEKEELLDKMMINQLISRLKEQDRRLITMRYFHDMTQVQVANRLGISQVQVSRKEKKILQSMRKEVE